MANLIIKPTSGGSLILQDEGGTAAHTIDASGNHTLSGTTNNIGTVTAGTISTGATIATGVHGKYTLDEHGSFTQGTYTSSTTASQDTINISGSLYITVTPAANSDIITFHYQVPIWMGGSSQQYMGCSIQRATNTSFSAGAAVPYACGRHAWGFNGGSNSDFYNEFAGTITKTSSGWGMTAGTTYYWRMLGQTHSTNSGQGFKWGTNVGYITGAAGGGVNLTMTRWSVV